MRLVNLTPHPVAIETPVGRLTVPPSGTVARVSETVVPDGTVVVDGLEVPVVRRGLGEVVDLPAPEPGTLYLVPGLVADAARDREDLVVPTDFVRDEAGRIIAARALARPAFMAKPEAVRLLTEAVRAIGEYARTHGEDELRRAESLLLAASAADAEDVLLPLILAVNDLVVVVL